MIIKRTLKVRLEISDQVYQFRGTLIKCLIKNKLNAMNKVKVKDIWFARK